MTIRLRHQYPDTKPRPADASQLFYNPVGIREPRRFTAACGPTQWH